MFTVFSKVHEVWEAQLKDIEGATSSILLEQYIIEDITEGDIGRRFIDALIRKQQQGVEVRCILDTQGSFQLFRNSALNALLSEAGGEIFYYKTLGLSHAISPARLALRDHRKLLLIDREISWIGGVVVGERFRDWDDLMVRFTHVPIADVLNKEFRNQLLRLQEKTNLLAPLMTIDTDYHISGNAPGIGNRFCYEEICHAIMRATESVTLVTPYFVPPAKLMRVMHRRLSDGLSITLLTPRRTDKTIVNLARESYMKKMLKKGLILKYSDRMIHAKVVIVDSRWMTFGSTNLDAVSLIFNHELNMVTRDKALIGSVQKIIDGWSDGLMPITFATCEYQNQSTLGRFIVRYVRYLA